jgi:hypothetical protein
MATTIATATATATATAKVSETATAMATATATATVKATAMTTAMATATVGTLKDGYVRNIPLPRAPRIQSANHMTSKKQVTIDSLDT